MTLPHATGRTVAPTATRHSQAHGPEGRRAAPGRERLALLVLLGALWGLHIVFAKAIGAESAREVLALLVLYVSAAALGLVVLALLRSRAFRADARCVRFFAVSSALGYMGPIFFELLVAPRIDASLFALVAGATPLATVGIAVAARRDRLSRTLALALAAGSAAALLLLGPAALGAGRSPPLWVALAFVVPLLYGAGDVFIEANWPPGLDLHQVSAGEGIAASIWAVALALAFGLAPADIVAAGLRAGWPAAGLVATALAATWLYFALIGREGAVFVSFASYVTIATGVLAGILLFGERPGPALAAAAVLTALALYLLNRDRAQAAPAAEGEPAR